MREQEEDFSHFFIRAPALIEAANLGFRMFRDANHGAELVQKKL